MKIIYKISIKAILFGVEENVIDNLNIGNNYLVKKDNLTNKQLWKEFDYTAFGIRRIYESAKINENLDIAVLEKNFEHIYDKPKNINFEEYLYNLENAEMHYVDEKMRIIRLFCENGFNIHELLINTNIILDNGKGEINHNSKIPFPDKIIGNIEKLNLNSKKEIDRINNFIQSIDIHFNNFNFSPNLLSSACFLYDQTYTASLETLQFMVGVIGLESLLVDGKGELSYKFSRNCAMLLSNNIEEYEKLFLQMKKIYKKRSEYVHNGRMKTLEEDDIVELRDILRKTIFKIIEFNIPQEELLKRLDLKGYL